MLLCHCLEISQACSDHINTGTPRSSITCIMMLEKLLFHIHTGWGPFKARGHHPLSPIGCMMRKGARTALATWCHDKPYNVNHISYIQITKRKH